MRALCSLWSLLAAAALPPPAPAPAPSAPPSLLVLRAACATRDPANFASSAALARLARLARPLRVLGYDDTCGPGWSATVTREALATMSGGGAVAMVGWAGAAACEALSAAARALRMPRPPVCALPSARAAAVARLAAQLGWRRAALPAVAAPLRSECRAALREVAHALAAAGITTHTLAPSSSDTDNPHLSQVEVRCVSREWGVAGQPRALPPPAVGSVLLLLHVDEPEVPAHPPASAPDPLPNVDSLLHRMPGDGIENTSSKPLLASPANYYRRAYGLLDTSLKYNISAQTDRDLVSEAGMEKNASNYRTIEIIRENIDSTENDEPMLDPIHRRSLDNLFSYIDKSVPWRNEYDLLVVSDHKLDGEGVLRALDQLHEDAVDAVRRARVADNARIETAHFTFHVYRRDWVAAANAWNLIASYGTVSTLALDDARDWLTDVHASNATDQLDRVAEEQPDSGRRAGATAGAAALSAGAGVTLAGAAALAVRWVAARRRRRRRGTGAVLSPADFSFPADERRCVGDGMETMLSCWLQQLHEFGGPELERPDLLKQPPVACVPSAPSSTCSVNRITLDRRVRYKGDAVHMKPVEVSGEAGTVGDGCFDLRRKAIDALLLMQGLRHENLNPFIGWLCAAQGGAGAGAGPALVWDYCGRGSLEDVLMADDIKLDWTFRLSLLTDLVKGMRYLHASPLRVHGRLSSRNCVVDSRWVLRLTDYGLGAFRRSQQLPPATAATARDLLWTAPELLRDPASRERGSQPGDVYSFAIVMQEVIVRGEPYCMLALSPEDIVEKLRRPPPLIRPSVSMGAAPPEAVSVMRQCWSEAPDMRPDFTRLHELFRHLHRGRKINIVDSMFEMLEKYSNNLEELIKERTEQLDMEKKKTEQLLNRMLPRSVAERLLAGSRVEPEEFSEVSIYFSDIVGFTALAARSSPVQVVDLLNDLYTTFDAAIQRYTVYKVETIGDAYMVVGGLPARARDHAESVATMALHLLHLAGRFRVRHLPDTPLHLRIGLHSGPCCAAVVGLTMPRYCLFGDTVNTASRMESTGAAWRIQVSAATAERLAVAGGYRLRSRGLVMIKGKGAMHTYWLLGKDGFDKPLPTPPPLPSEEVLLEIDGENDSELLSGSPPACAPSGSPSACVPSGSPTACVPSGSPTACVPRGSPALGLTLGAHSGPAGTIPTPAPTPGPAPAITELPALVALEPKHDQAPWCGRSGAVSAGSSPPAPAAGAAGAAGAPATYARYRWGGAGAGAGAGGSGLRRQWSLERGDALATAAAVVATERAPEDTPLALLRTVARAPPPRYRMRPDLPHDPP